MQSNILSDLNEIAQSNSIVPDRDFSVNKQTSSKIRIKRIMTENSAADSIAESEYKYIPNNFKMKEGVAFQVAGSKINLDGGISGIYNMGNTCFMSTGNNLIY